MITKTGPCKFCGQIGTFMWNEETPITEEEEMEQATLQCNCDSAKWYKDRAYKINAANERLDNMLQQAEEQRALKALKEIVPALYDEEIFSIAINIGNGTKVDMRCKIKEDKKIIKIKRTDVEVREEMA